MPGPVVHHVTHHRSGQTWTLQRERNVERNNHFQAAEEKNVQQHTYHHDLRVESRRFDVCTCSALRFPLVPLQLLTSVALFSYNRYLSVAAQAVRRSLKPEIRVKIEAQTPSELKVAPWKVSTRWPHLYAE
ncbi:hypothetical protein H101_02242 [Trichophyton interdigitale H6]|nr:hypothetical protein H101_02242 [Trichophyton interdigitale H6]